MYMRAALNGYLSPVLNPASKRDEDTVPIFMNSNRTEEQVAKISVYICINIHMPEVNSHEITNVPSN